MIEDNESVVQMMEVFFKRENWDVVNAADGKQGLDLFLENEDKFDIITLDLNLPTLDGIEVAKRIREKSATVPIIMLTARDSESDEVIGFEVGADEYVTKPFSPFTLVARIKALYRRVNATPGVAAEENDVTEVRTPSLLIDLQKHEVQYKGQLMPDLTPKEFDLLVILASNPRKVFKREQLLQQVWKYEFTGELRTVDAHVKKLRQKLEPFDDSLIKTVWGVGYRFEDN
jgi:two-component system OmpR family response regulator